MQPADLVLRHDWLFRQSWVEESAGDVIGDDYDHRARAERTAELRAQAVAEVFACGGAEAVLRLAQRGQAAHIVGSFLAQIPVDRSTLVDALAEIANGGVLSGTRGQVMEGALLKADDGDNPMLRSVASRVAPEKTAQLLMLARFEGKTWTFVGELSDDIQTAYWNGVNPRWSPDPADLPEGVKRLIAARRPRAAFQLSQLDLKELPVPLLYALLVAILTNSTEAANTYMLDPYYLREAFKLMNDSGEITTDQMAGLEFQFIDIFGRGEIIPVNLSRNMAAQPDSFVQAVAFFTKRRDDQEDPPELRVNDEETRSSRAKAAYRLLDVVEFIPGVPNGELEAARIVAWVEQAQASLSALARLDIGDQMIGKILAKAPAAEDKVWPCLPVRDALELVANQHIERGMHVALRNARGAHWRGEGGVQERELAAKYQGWADAMAYTHPRVAAILRGVEKAYLSEADWEDNDAKIARRMR